MRSFLIIASAFIFLAGCGVQTQTNHPVAQSATASGRTTSSTDNLSDVPGPTPTPIPTPVPTQAPANNPQPITQPAHANAPAPPVNPRWRVVGPGVNIGIAGTYSDCTGNSPVGYGGLYFYSCAAGLWIMGHVTLFGGADSWGVGTVVHYFDGNGTNHVYTIRNSVVVTNRSYTNDGAPVHFQVCLFNTSTSPIRVLSAS